MTWVLLSLGSTISFTVILNSALKQLALGGQWVSRRLKAIRFGIICLPGRVVSHARKLVINLSRGHPAFGVLCRARQTIAAMANAPPAV